MSCKVRKNNLIYGALILLVCFLCVFPGVKVHGAPVAKVGGRTYSSFDKAFNAINNRGTITLLKNASVSSFISLDKNKRITVNLNRHTLSTTNGGTIWIKAGTVTFKNGTIKKKGKDNTVLYIVQKGSVILQNVKYFGHIQIGNFNYSKNNGSLLIKGGTYKTGSKKDFLISNFGKLTIESGTFQNTYSDNMYGVLRTFGTCTINGGTFSSKGSKNYIYIGALSGHKSKTTINGGTFKRAELADSHIEGCLYVYNNCNVIFNDGRFYGSFFIQGGNVIMNGGSITSPGPTVRVDPYYGGKVGKFTMRGGKLTALFDENSERDSASAIAGENINIQNGTITGGATVEEEIFIYHVPVISTSSVNTVYVSNQATIINNGNGNVVGTDIIEHK